MQNKSILAVLFIWALLFTSCSDEKSSDVSENVSESYYEYVSGYTAGVISKKSEIRVDLVNPIDPKEVGWDNIKADLLTFSPEIEGELHLVDNSSIVFSPSQYLPSGQSYVLTFNLNKLVEVPDSLATLEYRFEVMPQNFDVKYNGITVENDNNSKKVKLQGALEFADWDELSNAKKLLKAELSGKVVEIDWLTEEKEERYFKFEINDIKRKVEEQTIKLIWDGSVLDLPNKGDREISIPSLDEFKLISARVVTHPTRYISLTFSDPVDADQDFNGMIEIEGMSGLKFEVENNEVKVYTQGEYTGDKFLKIYEGLKNVDGYKIKNTVEAEVIFEQLKPQVRFVSSGNILPSSQGMILPFEAVSLKAVDVRVKKIYSNNILQFLQVNDIGGDYQLRRVAKEIKRKVIPLTQSGIGSLNKWNRFTLNLEDLIKTEPGAIYQVEIAFKSNQSLYNCGQGKEKDKNVNTSSTNSDSYWNDNDSYYYGDYNWRERDNPCNSAYYGSRRSISTNVFASDIGLITKKGENGQYWVIATDLLTAKPLSGVSIQLFDYQQQVIKKGTTDDKGVFSFKHGETPHVIVASKREQKAYLKINGNASLSLSKFDVGGEYVHKGIKGFVYGERGVWRPGDSLFFGFILEDKQKLIPATQPVVFKLTNPRGQTVQRKAIKKGLNGVYVFKTKTDEDVPTGNWSLNVSAGGTSFHHSVKIETIKPNRLKVKLDFGKDFLTSEDRDLSGKLQVKWLHGAIGANMKAEYDMKLVKSSFRPKKYKAYSFSNPSLNFHSENQRVLEGKTNAEGIAKIETTISLPEQVPAKLMAVFNGKVYEPSGNFSIDYQSISFYPYESMLGLKVDGADKYYESLETDSTHSVDIVNVDHDGKLVTRNDVEVALYKLEWRWWWDYSYGRSNYQNKQNRRLISSGKVDLNNGKGKWDFKVNYPEWGRFLVEVKDPVSGHVSGKIIYIDWPYWRGSSKGGMKEGAAMLMVNTDKEKYTTGEEVTLNVPSSKGGRVLVSLENGSKVIKTIWQDCSEKQTEVKFNVDASMAPNIYANVMVLQPHMQTVNDLPIRMYGVVPIFVDEPKTHLEPRIEMPKVLEPEQQVSIKVSEKEGKAMTYTIAMVDEGLLDLTNYKTPKPWKYFYAREALGVQTWDLFDEVMGAFGGDLQRLLALGGDESKNKDKNSKAKRFKPVVKFFGPYHIEAGASKTTNFKMPNYIGSVRTMVIGAYEGAYGSSEETTPVRQSLMVLGTLPRVLGPNEVVELPVTVFAMDNKVKEGNITITTNDKVEVIGSKTQKVTFAKPGEKIVTFRLLVRDKLGIAEVKIKGEGAGKKSYHNMELDVRSPNPPVTRVYDKLLEQGETWSSEFSNIGVEGTNAMAFEVSGMPSVNLEQRLKYLIQYPHGCIEQTTSSVFPQLYLDKISNLTDQTRKRIDINVKDAINRLYRFKRSSGGLSYWPGNVHVSEWGTCYATHFLLEAKKKGYYVQEAYLSHALSYLSTTARSFSSGKDYHQMNQAYRLYVLALAGKPEAGAMNRFSERTDLNAAVRYRLAAAYALIGRKEMAEKLIAGVTVEAQTSRDWYWHTYGSLLRDQAMALETYLLIGKKEDAFELLVKVADQLGNNSWHSTQTTAMSLYAYSKYAEKYSGGKSIRVNYTVDAAGRKELFGQQTVLKKSFDASLKDNHKMKFENTSDQPLYVRVYSTGVPLEVQTNNVQSKLNLSVWYTDMKGKTIDVTTLKQGTEFKVHMKVQNPGVDGHYRNLALTEIIPPGWEIRNTRLNEGSTGNENRVDYIDIRDDRINLYFGLNSLKSKTFTFEMHASFTGEFALPPVLCTDMYNEKIKAQVGGKEVQVVK